MGLGYGAGEQIAKNRPKRRMPIHDTPANNNSPDERYNQRLEHAVDRMIAGETAPPYIMRLPRGRLCRLADISSIRGPAGEVYAGWTDLEDDSDWINIILQDVDEFEFRHINIRRG